MGIFTKKFVDKKLKYLFVTIFILSLNNIYAQVDGDFQTSVASGNWSSFLSWNIYNNGLWVASTGQLPTATTSVFIQNGNTIIVDDANAVCNNLNFTAPGTTPKVNQAANSVLTIHGNINQNATSNNPFPNHGAGAKIVFAGAVNQTITNSSALTNLNIVEVNKTGGDFILPTNVITKFDNFTLTSGRVIVASGADLQGLSSSSVININAGLWRQIEDATIINGGSATVGIPINIRAGQMQLRTTSTSGFHFSDVSITNGGGLTLFENTMGGNTTISGSINLDEASTFTTFLQSTPAPPITNFLGTVFYSRAGNQNVIPTSYGILEITGSSGTKTATANITVTNRLSIRNPAVFTLGTNTATITGNWSNWGTAGFDEATSTVIFNSPTSQTLNTFGGENFYKLHKSGTGNLSLSNDVALDGLGSELNISNGIISANDFSLTGTLSTAFIMSGGGLQSSKLNTTLPEFPITSGYNITGGTIFLNGIGDQTLRGSRDYANIEFLNSGTKTITSAINNISGTVTLNGTVVLDVDNNSFGGAATNLTLLGTSRFKTAGTGTKPDMGGVYTLSPGTAIEFSNNATTLQSIRLSRTYANIDVSGSSVGNGSAVTGITMQPNARFTVKTGATFKLFNNAGFSGATASAISNANNPIVVVEPNSTVSYEGINQTITNDNVITTPTIGNYYNIILSGTGTKTAPSSTLNILGNFNKITATTFNANNGIVAFSGNDAVAQTFNTIDNVDFSTLLNNNISGGLAVNSGNLGIQKLLTLSPSSKLIFGAGNINIRSTAATTAAIDKIANNVTIDYTGAGRFKIERFVGYTRKWQLLSIPTTEAGHSFKTEWMENAAAKADNPTPSYGMQITKAMGASGTGFDTSSITASVKYYNPATNNFEDIANTTDNIQAQNGYYAFVRGDRNAQSNNTANAPTRLRTTGKINKGDTTIALPLAGKLYVVGNPYASAIDLRNVIATNVKGIGTHPHVFVWDPTIAGMFGVGKYVALSFNGTNYIADNTGGLYFNETVSNFIQSGQAFFIDSTTAANATIAFHENDKVTGSNTVSFTENQTPILRVNMFTLNNGVDAVSADGAAVIFGDDKTNDINSEDLGKFLNTTDNLAIKTSNKLLAIERKHTITSNDTIPLSITNMKAMKYRFVISLNNLAAQGRAAFLKDNFTNTITPLSIEGETTVNFTISDAASAVANRFMIMFTQTPKPTFIQVNAVTNKNKTNVITWQIDNPASNSNYSIQRSADSIAFYEIGTVNVPTTANNPANIFTFTDDNPLATDNFYKIKLTSNNSFIFSQTVKVNKIISDVSIKVTPNIITDKIIRLQFNNQPIGDYEVTVTALNGTKVWSSLIKINSYIQTTNLAANNLLPGAYFVTIKNGKKTSFSQKIIIQ